MDGATFASRMRVIHGQAEKLMAALADLEKDVLADPDTDHIAESSLARVTTLGTFIGERTPRR
jgi:hypothetical protein